MKNLLGTLPSLLSAIDRYPTIVGSESLLIDAVTIMNQHRESDRPILILEANQIIGIFTKQDLVKLTNNHINLDGLKIAAVMTRNPQMLIFSAEQNLLSTLTILQRDRISYLPIIDDRQQLIGTISIDLIHEILKSIDPLEILRVAAELHAQSTDLTTQLERSNRELRAEITRREQVEDRLRRASQTLEERMAVTTAESVVLTDRVHTMALEQESCDLSLEASQQGISDFIQNATIGIHWVDANGIVVLANHAEMTMLGYSSAEYIGQPLHDFHVDRSAIKCVFNRLLNNEPIIGCESQMIRKDGSICDVSINSNALFKDGKFIHARCFTRDISHQKRAEADLRQSEQKYREQAAMLNIATDAIIVRDLTSKIQFWNDGAEVIYGWKAIEAIDQNARLLFDLDDMTTAKIALDSIMATGLWHGEIHKLTKSGQEVIVDSRCSLVYDEAGNPRSILSVETDITKKKQLEQQFFRVQRLESLGTLATGIAHDLNNILTPILGAAQLLPLTLPTLTDRNQRLLTMLVESSKRGSSLVKQILSFARGLDREYTLLQVRHILTEIISVARQTFPKSIEIGLDLDTEDLWMVYVDATQIHQVLMNLFINARDAMPDGGAIAASARNTILDDSYTSRNPHVSAGAYIAIAIADTGMGMDVETIDRIFDAFFTTKESGTGLGLSTVLGIVKAHGGFIDVESELGRGSTFKIYLPAVKNRIEDRTISIPELFDGHGKLVLVIDDEVSIREITKHSLEVYNYHAMLASDGVEALALYAQNWNRIAVVMIDMMMPHLDTPSVILALQQINPAVKIIAMSGSASNEGIVEQYQLQGFLIKPFNTIEMMHALAEISVNM